VALRLAKAGYYGGDPAAVLEARVDLVLAALQYEAFTDEYERSAMELNRGDGAK
jgi:hypothetical protein